MTGHTKTRLLPLFGLLALGAAQAQQTMRLTLADAQRLAIQNNPQFSAARYTAAAANQAPNQYKAGLQPNLSGNFTSVGADNGSRIAAGGLTNPTVYDRVGSGLTISQLITDFGRTNNLIGMAKLQAAAQDQFTEATRADILLATSSAYFAVLSAQSVLQVVDETVKARQEVVDQVTALAESKLRSTLDVSFANVNLSGARLLQVQAENELKAAEARLAEAIGLPGEPTFVLADEPMPPAMPDRVQDLIDAAIQNRPELKNLRLQQSAAERLAKAEHALYFPSVGVLGAAGFAPAAVAQVPGRYGAIGLNISIPIFNGGLFKARQTEAELKARAAGENVTDLQNRVIRDVRIAWLNATTAYDRMALTQQLVQQAQLAMDLSQSRYDLGLAAIVELSQAQLNLTAAQISNTTARYDYQAQRSNVDFQTGTLR
jgi:outer membrane protein